MERRILGEILEMYRDFPCLWDTTNEQYSRKDTRQEALYVLMLKWKEIDPEASVDTVKRKIENMRTTFFREWKKVQNSRDADPSGDLVYTPTLWYFDHMLFLVEKQNPRRSVTATKNPQDQLEMTKRRFKRRMIEMKRRQASVYSATHSHSISHQPTGVNNPTATLAQAYAYQLKEMTRLQRCIAEKMIAEVLFYGKLELLTLQSTLLLNNDACESIGASGSRMTDTPKPIFIETLDPQSPSSNAPTSPSPSSC